MLSPRIKIVVVGHVDHGKSTLIGRLMHEAGALRSGQLETVRAVSERRGASLEWAFLLDTLQVERDQGVTVETTRVQLTMRGRDYLFIDAPGHKQFIKSMISGASDADAALLVIDCQDGIREQTLRHLHLLDVLGLRQIIVAFNKMDLVGYDEEWFNTQWRDLCVHIDRLTAKMTFCLAVPVCARDGEGLMTPATGRMPWYRGPSLLSALEMIRPPENRCERPLRMPVQDIYRFGGRRLIVGRIQAGTLKIGDSMLFSPSGQASRVTAIECWNAPKPIRSASAGQCVAIALEDELFVEPGEMATHPGSAPCVSDSFSARLFWLDSQKLVAGKQCRIRLGDHDSDVTIERVERFGAASGRGATVDGDGLEQVVIRTRRPVVFDEVADDPHTARFALIGDCRIVGGGIITKSSYCCRDSRLMRRSTNIMRVPEGVVLSSRWRANGHKSGVLWLTGLSCSGKSTLAVRLESLLFAEGYQVATLDGDNLRFGLNADLGFEPKDRAENVRRAGEVAALLAERGLVVIAAFISPYAADRDRIRARCAGLFHEIYLSADVTACEARDSKGLYRRARNGEIADFTGVSAPYERPSRPELVIDTGSTETDESLMLLADYARKVLALESRVCAETASLQPTGGAERILETSRL